MSKEQSVIFPFTYRGCTFRFCTARLTKLFQSYLVDGTVRFFYIKGLCLGMPNTRGWQSRNSALKLSPGMPYRRLSWVMLRSIEYRPVSGTRLISFGFSNDYANKRRTSLPSLICKKPQSKRNKTCSPHPEFIPILPLILLIIINIK